MKKTLLLLSILLAFATSFGQQVITRSNVNLRSAPNTGGRIIFQIPRGTVINLEECHSEWCEVTVNGQHGYVAKRYAVSRENYQSDKESKNDPAQALEPIRHYTNSRGNVIQSPTRYDKAPSGATAKCRDGSFSFSQSRRGTCSHHGGVAEWLR